MIGIFIASSSRFSSVEWMTPYSIQKNSSQDYPIHVIRPESVGMEEHGCTGFTNVRYAVPELCREYGYDFGIYLDVDMLVLGDIVELAGYARRHKWVCLDDGSNEVSVICSTLKFPRKEKLHTFKKWELPRDFTPLIPKEWNVEDEIKPGMKLLHFTAMDHQPWFYEHPDHEVAKKYIDWYASYHSRNRAESDAGSNSVSQRFKAAKVRMQSLLQGR